MDFRDRWARRTWARTRPLVEGRRPGPAAHQAGARGSFPGRLKHRLLGAMRQGSSDRYFQEDTSKVEKLVPEGIEGRVPYKGPLLNIVHQLIGGIRSSMGYVGCANIDEMRTRPEFVRVTAAGMRESHVHDVTITKEAPNYRVD